MTTSIGQEKIAPYMVFSEKKTLVCVEKDHEYKEGEDLSKYESFNSKGKLYFVD